MNTCKLIFRNVCKNIRDYLIYFLTLTLSVSLFYIATNIGLTIVLFLLVYGSYFLATYLSCKRIVTEQRELEV